MTSKYESQNNRDQNQLETDRYAAVSHDDGDVVVYDTTNDDAWLKSDAAVDVASMA